MRTELIEQELLSMRDEEYAGFQRKLLPTVPADRIIGVRTPQLRALAKKIAKDGETDLFLAALPHNYFEEDQLHAFIISLDKDIRSCLTRVEAFLPYIDNWATCDQLSPVSFAADPGILLQYIRGWIRSENIYTVRFALVLLMRHFLDDLFSEECIELAASAASGEYYIDMAKAWYFATALAKQYDAALPYLELRKLDIWTHNKAIQKSIESYRISAERKEYLRTLKIRG